MRAAVRVDGVDGGAHVSVASEHDSDRIGRKHLDPGQKLNAIHPGHAHIGDHDGKRPVFFDHLQGLFSAEPGFEEKLAA
jgi:hypothetical protein